MKKVLIVEDEKPASSQLTRQLNNLDASILILGIIDSVEDAISWFANNPSPDLAFFDIQLADGLSFSIFEKVEVNCPVIFTTAFDQYAIKAFKFNSIDYLLKPIDQEELEFAWNKYLAINSSIDPTLLSSAFRQMSEQVEYRERFLIKRGDQFKYVKIKDIAYFFSDGGLSFLVDDSGMQYIIDEKIESLIQSLDPARFFRINRKFIVGEAAVSTIYNHFNSRLKIDLLPPFKEEVIVAREKVKEFKNWLNK